MEGGLLGGRRVRQMEPLLLRGRYRHDGTGLEWEEGWEGVPRLSWGYNNV